MGYGVEIWSLEKVIKESEKIKNRAFERFTKDPNDQDLQDYKDYQQSIIFYLNELKNSKL